jgi:nucleoside-diphosphate-sugar epimerase
VRVLVVGAGGDLGVKVRDLLLAQGHDVWGLTRSQRRLEEMERRHVRGVLGDLMAAGATTEAIRTVGPDAIVAVPIALPERGPIRPRDLADTNRLRVTGTRNLLDAALRVGVKRLVLESIVAVYGYGEVDGCVDESTPTQRRAPLPALQSTVDAMHRQEELVAGAARSGSIEAVIVRLGFYYGQDVGTTRFMATLLRRGIMPVARTSGAMPWIEIHDAAAGVVAALSRGRSGEVYNIVGDESVGLSDLARELARRLGTRPPRTLPAWLLRFGGRYAALVGETRLYVSNAKAKQELGWRPQYPTVADGLAQAAKHL